jgi:hypothetical protein
VNVALADLDTTPRSNVRLARQLDHPTDLGHQITKCGIHPKNASAQNPCKIDGKWLESLALIRAL